MEIQRSVVEYQAGRRRLRRLFQVAAQVVLAVEPGLDRLAELGRCPLAQEIRRDIPKPRAKASRWRLRTAAGVPGSFIAFTKAAGSNDIDGQIGSCSRQSIPIIAA